MPLSKGNLYPHLLGDCEGRDLSQIRVSVS